ncbi:MAG TPA: hypothetical protein VF821_02550, partial [Lentzea sp.]
MSHIFRSLHSPVCGMSIGAATELHGELQRSGRTMVTLGHTIAESQLLMVLIGRPFRHAWVTMA